MRYLAWTVFPVLAVGCGSITYGGGSEEVVETQTQMQGYYVAAPTPAPVYEPRVTVFQPPPQVVPPPPQFAAPPPRFVVPPPPPAMAPAPARLAVGNGVVTCSGNDRVRVYDRVVDGGHGPAVVASGNCIVELNESIVRGHPAIHASGNAVVRVIESRIQGDILASRSVRIDSHGSRHRGSRIAL